MVEGSFSNYVLQNMCVLRWQIASPEPLPNRKLHSLSFQFVFFENAFQLLYVMYFDVFLLATFACFSCSLPRDHPGTTRDPKGCFWGALGVPLAPQSPSTIANYTRYLFNPCFAKVRFSERCACYGGKLPPQSPPKSPIALAIFSIRVFRK